MEQQVYKVVRSSFQSEELAIQHVRQRGQGLPIAQVPVLKNPAHTVPAQAAPNDGVSGDSVKVVVIDKLEMPGRPIDSQCGERQQDANQPDAAIETASGLPGFKLGLFLTG